VPGPTYGRRRAEFNKKMSDVAIETPNALITSPSTISIFAFFFYSVIFIFHVIFHVIMVAISPI
jgi:hypothetical protein